ncbi:MAG: prepilin-type N-terminal cleavage/methylation domain-containing protein [Candidatus Omnitrophica bacterium]|nr:prepilin-type N-terminal cleavage/methylation domain-containing protein [Candidatus Omnitrophota bacterium]
MDRQAFIPLESSAKKCRVGGSRESVPLENFAKRCRVGGSRGRAPLESSAKRSSLTGFTLVEVLITTVIVAVISLAIYSSLAQGLSLYQRVRTGVPEEDVNIFFYKFNMDLKNSFVYQEQGFSGNEEEFSFWTLTPSRQFEAKTAGKVSYRFDPGSEILSRRVSDYSEVAEGSEPQDATYLGGVRMVRLAYYFFDEEKKEYEWRRECTEEDILPFAVRVEVALEDGVDDSVFTKTVFLPRAG